MPARNTLGLHSAAVPLSASTWVYPNAEALRKWYYRHLGVDVTDWGGATFVQIVPAKFQALGTEKQAKGYVEDFSNATAGLFVKRPFAVQRLTGI